MTWRKAIRLPARPPDLTPEAITAAVAALPALLGHVSARDRYHHWDRIRFMRPPADVRVEDWWAAIKLVRRGQSRPVPLHDTKGSPFTFCVPDAAAEMLHGLDKGLAGQIALSEMVTGTATRDRYIVSSLMEEAITSSQLEGASTTRKVAKDMIRSGRPPRDRSERMIFNNYIAMEQVRQLKDEPLTPQAVLGLHRLVTAGTLSDPSFEGRLQRPGDERVRIFIADVPVHEPPPAELLPKRLQEMCDFANGATGDGFIHPVVRAMILHFWLAYDHPFEDGNGRTARVLFYWSLLRQGYWLAEFITISRILHAAPTAYARSFLLTETDGNDLTYFLLYQLEVMTRALRELEVYLARKTEETREAQALLRQATALNRRQLDLIAHALRHPEFLYTVESHRRSHAVVYETARSDLLDLVAKELLVQSKVGRAFAFTPAGDLPRRLRSLGSAKLTPPAARR